ncbi:uncharacterized protein FIBRA_08256 [Fibroporia radiculosa]|uniref:tripeptidyl-peptidase II n=1 Tax=Fibroporia radiculosa TaxID=599839 RepID=J4GGY2_9APHY|nr:uncharacterized protein FIBRA_08256 [Fibroporia radiculosa]CCM06013.1 predicted protein [Fibroporia radiculosa]
MLGIRALVVLAALLCAVAAPSSSSPFVVHESRSHVPLGWTPLRRADADMILPLRVGLAQPNLENLEAYIMDVSHPHSSNYGKHWSAAKVAETFRPTAETVDTVRAWLTGSGIEANRVKLTSNGGWLTADVSVAEAERLLGTEYFVYQSANEDQRHIACHEKYHLPEHVSKHVELVSPTLHFDARVGEVDSRPVGLERRNNEARKSSKYAVGQPGFGTSFPKTTGTVEAGSSYGVSLTIALTWGPKQPKVNALLVEYTPQAYLPADLDMFFKKFSPSQVGERPIMNSIDGGYLQTEFTNFSYNGESDLDFQYSMALVGSKQPVNLYQAGDMVEGASFNNLLDALDASYCTFEGGDDPTYDSIYPDPEGGGYEGPEDCGTIKPAYIMSTSYGYNEADLTPAYEQRQCAEYAKLGLMGTTVLYSSGDGGVAGNEDLCLNADGTQTANGTMFNPSFPGTCPYITSVGATQVNPNATVWEPESACEQVIYSGGGFSNVFKMPSYQKAAVERYLSEYPPPYSSAQYNTSGSRGFPDIAANGANYVVAMDGEFELVYGTSAASPVSAAILSAVNDARLAIGKGPIGFINPTIYTAEFMMAFNDITTGSNPGCGTEGFNARPGWDPVTGLGTPNFAKLLPLWLALP